MKKKSVEELARAGEELAAAGVEALEVVDAVGKQGLGEKRGAREVRAGDEGWLAGVGAEGIHPWRLVESDVNGIARLCQAIHAFGEGRMRTCRRILENPGMFGKEVRMAAWRALTGMSSRRTRERYYHAGDRVTFIGKCTEGTVVLWEWARLRAGLRNEGEGWVRCLVPDGGRGRGRGGVGSCRRRSRRTGRRSSRCGGPSRGSRCRAGWWRPC